METRKFNKTQVSDILYEGYILNNDNEEIFCVVSDEVVDTDQEKGRVTRNIVIEEITTNKFFSADLDESPWYKQAEANAEKVWQEVVPYDVTVTKYRKVK